jgi:FkbH-like protein
MERLAFLSNININSLKFRIANEYNLFFPKGYNTLMQELMDISSEFYKFQPRVCFFILDGHELFISSTDNNYIQEIFSCIEFAQKELPQCYFLISDLDVYNPGIDNYGKIGLEYKYENLWLERLEKYIKEHVNTYRFPLKNIITEHGRNAVYSQKMWYLASNRFSVTGEKLLVNRVQEFIRPLHIVPKKCLVLDLDNTLWGGVIGEDGVDGIQLEDHGEGARFSDFQKLIKEIGARGILLAIISKNNSTDVEKAFADPRMILKKHDFVSMITNWNSKSSNMIKMANDLNFGLDAFVFIDDNPVEREAMRQQCPDVVVADFPEDTSRLMQFAQDIYSEYFYLIKISDEDIKKARMYSENAERNAALSQFSSLKDFLINMKINISVKKANSEYITRIFQMIQKTNQFNLTTKRYSEEDILNMLSNPDVFLFIGQVQDKYGDNGNSILSIVRKLSEREAEIDLFLMSCRVMNRTIEFGFLYEVERLVKESGIGIIYGKYIRTSKNGPAEMFFDDAGYDIILCDNDEKRYKLMIDRDARNMKESYVSIERV